MRRKMMAARAVVFYLCGSDRRQIEYLLLSWSVSISTFTQLVFRPCFFESKLLGLD